LLKGRPGRCSAEEIHLKSCLEGAQVKKVGACSSGFQGRNTTTGAEKRVGAREIGQTALSNISTTNGDPGSTPVLLDERRDLTTFEAEKILLKKG